MVDPIRNIPGPPETFAGEEGLSPTPPQRRSSAELAELVAGIRRDRELEGETRPQAPASVQVSDVVLANKLQLRLDRMKAIKEEPGFFRKTIVDPTVGVVTGVAGAAKEGFERGFSTIPMVELDPIERGDDIFPSLLPERVLKDLQSSLKMLQFVGAGGVNALVGIFEGGLAASQQVLIEMGASQTTAKKLTRDHRMVSEVIAIIFGLSPITAGTGIVKAGRVTKEASKTTTFKRVFEEESKRQKSFVTSKNINEAVKEAKAKSTTVTEGEIRTAIIKKLGRDLDDVEVRAMSAPVLRAPDQVLDEVPVYTQPVLTSEARQRAITTAQDILRDRGIDPTGLAPQRVQQLISDLISTSESFTGRLVVDAKAAGFDTIEDFLDAFLFTGSEAGRTLGELSRFFVPFRQRLRKAIAKGEPGADEAARILKNMAEKKGNRPGLLGYEAAETFMTQATRIFRKLLITPPATANRNFIEAAVVRVPINIMTRTFDNILSRVFTPGAPRQPIDPFGELANIFVVPIRARKIMTKFLDEFPEVRPLIYRAVEADIQRTKLAVGVTKGPIGTSMDVFEVGIDKVGLWLNRAQEFVVRNGVFPAALDRRLRRVGSSLEEVVDEGIIPAGFDLAVSESLEEALFVTYALDTKSRRPLARMFEGYATMIDASKIGIAFEPFAKFMFSATRFIMEFFPTAGLRLVTPSNRARIAAGDMDVLAREISGTALLVGAIALRQGNVPGLAPGELHNEFLTKEGMRISVGPIMALNAILFMADTLIRIDEGRLQTSATDFKAWRRGLMGSAPQTGAVSASVQDAFDALLGIRTLKDFQRLGEVGGTVFTGALRPLQPIRDLRAEYNEAVDLQRETRGRGFAGPVTEALTRAIPGLDPATLPERESPTREATPTTPRIELPFGIPSALPGGRPGIGAGLLTQLSGLTVRERRNTFEKERVFLGFQGKDLSPKTGSKRLDSLVSRFQGPLNEMVGDALFRTSLYRYELPIRTRQEVFRNVLLVTREAALITAKIVAPVAFAELSFKRLPIIQQEAIFQELNLILRDKDPEFDLEALFKELQGIALKELEGAGL